MCMVIGGAVFTGRILDYEDRSSYTIIIQANDTPEEGMPSRYVLNNQQTGLGQTVNEYLMTQDCSHTSRVDS